MAGVIGPNDPVHVSPYQAKIPPGPIPAASDCLDVRRPAPRLVPKNHGPSVSKPAPCAIMRYNARRPAPSVRRISGYVQAPLRKRTSFLAIVPDGRDWTDARKSNRFGPVNQSDCRFRSGPEPKWQHQHWPLAGRRFGQVKAPRPMRPCGLFSTTARHKDGSRNHRTQNQAPASKGSDI